METDQTEQAIAKIVREVFSGQLSYLEATRPLLTLLREVGVCDDDPDLLALVVVDSESDHLPIGSQRQNWSAEALERKAQELDHCEAWAKRTAEEHLRSLLHRYEQPAVTPQDS
jgi:hypothetical protein